MSMNDLTRDQLIALLAYQVGAGADEALCNQPAHDAPYQSIQTFLAASSTPEAPTPKNIPKSKPLPANSPVLKNSPAMTNSHVAADSGLALDGGDLQSITSLEALRVALEQLEGCALRNTASNLVFCDGNPGARVMIVGEAPGRDEDRVGLPFVGAAGQLLDKMLASINLDRSTVYITNLLPWRPPGNRTPTAEETQLLLPYLRRHIQLARPELVLILGGSSAKALLNTKEGILKMRGVWRDVDYGGGVTVPTLASLHPAYLLRSPAQKRLSFDDLLSLRARLA
jgi:DNA polymerase